MCLNARFFLNLASFSGVCAHPAKELRTGAVNAIRPRSTPNSSTRWLYYGSNGLTKRGAFAESNRLRSSRELSSRVRLA